MGNSFYNLYFKNDSNLLKGYNFDGLKFENSIFCHISRPDSIEFESFYVKKWLKIFDLYYIINLENFKMNIQNDSLPKEFGKTN